MMSFGLHEQRSTHACVPPGETVECDASASKYSYSAIFEYVTNALYPSDVSKEYKRGLRKRAAFFSVEAGHLFYVGGKTKQRPRMVIEKEELV